MSKSDLYFLSDRYYQDFPDDKLMKNKDTVNGVPRSRPCFYVFPDTAVPEIYWIVPVSSQCSKYRKLEQEKIAKYGKCNTIRFGRILDRDSAFLIQNMCPATEKYLIAYVDKNNSPIGIDSRVAKDVIRNARQVLAMAKRGAKVIYPDVFKIYEELKKQIKENK